MIEQRVGEFERDKRNTHKSSRERSVQERKNYIQGKHDRETKKNERCVAKGNTDTYASCVGFCPVDWNDCRSVRPRSVGWQDSAESSVRRQEV
jgi:hypothetical protein